MYGGEAIAEAFPERENVANIQAESIERRTSERGECRGESCCMRRFSCCSFNFIGHCVWVMKT